MSNPKCKKCGSTMNRKTTFAGLWFTDIKKATLEDVAYFECQKANCGNIVLEATLVKQ